MPTIVIYVEFDDDTDTFLLQDQCLAAAQRTVKELEEDLSSSNLKVYQEVIDDPQ